MLKLQAVFIDRDGTIGGTDEVVYPGSFKQFPFVASSMDLLKRHNKLIFAFTNQPGISRGEVTTFDFEKELLTFGFDKIYLCPHQHGEGCTCRKPLPGMLLKAGAEYKLDLTKCAVIGDRWTDLLAAHEVGAIKILVRTGAGQQELNKYNKNEFFGKWAEVNPDYIAENLMDAVSWLLAEGG